MCCMHFMFIWPRPDVYLLVLVYGPCTLFKGHETPVFQQRLVLTTVLKNTAKIGVEWRVKSFEASHKCMHAYISNKYEHWKILEEVFFFPTVLKHENTMLRSHCFSEKQWKSQKCASCARMSVFVWVCVIPPTYSLPIIPIIIPISTPWEAS